MPAFSAAGPPITFEQLVEHVSALQHPPADLALFLLDDARERIGPLGAHFEQAEGRYHVWQVGAAVLAALASLDTPVRVPPNGARAVGTAEKLALLTRAGGLAAASRIAEGANASDLERRRTILRILCTRSSLQRDFVYQFSLTLHLLGVWDVAKDQAGDGFCDALFQTAFACTAREYAEMMFTFWAMAAQACVFRPSTWFESSEDPERYRALLARIIASLSCPAIEVRVRIREDFARYEADGLVQAWFAQRPFVAAEDASFLAAPLPFLRLAASSSAFYQTLALAREDAARRGSEKPWTNKYSSEMGRRFESFMHFILAKARAPGDVVWEEYAYQRGDNALSADFIVTSTRRQREVLVVQAKLKRLVPGAFYGFSTDDFRADAKGALAELVWKSLRYLHRVHTTADERLEETHQPLHETIRQAESIVLLGVVPSMPSLFQADEFRALILEGASEKLSEQERAWVDANKARFTLWHVLDAEELCAFVAVRAEANRTAESLLAALRTYLTLPGFGDLARTDGMFSSFRDWYVAAHTDQGGRQRIPELKRVFDAFCAATTRKFFPQDGT